MCCEYGRQCHCKQRRAPLSAVCDIHHIKLFDTLFLDQQKSVECFRWINFEISIHHSWLSCTDPTICICSRLFCIQSQCDRASFDSVPIRCLHRIETPLRSNSCQIPHLQNVVANTQRPRHVRCGSPQNIQDLPESSTASSHTS